MSTLDELEALLAKATPAPWAVKLSADLEPKVLYTESEGGIGQMFGDGAADAALIAAARNALGDLIKIARAAEHLSRAYVEEYAAHRRMELRDELWKALADFKEPRR